MEAISPEGYRPVLLLIKRDYLGKAAEVGIH